MLTQKPTREGGGDGDDEAPVHYPFVSSNPNVIVEGAEVSFDEPEELTEENPAAAFDEETPEVLEELEGEPHASLE